MKWLADGGCSVDIPKKPKKITGTRFGAVLGQNPWQTPFKAWCEMTKTYQDPFESSIYTEAGKKIEPKQIEYYSKLALDDVITPEGMYGKDFFKTMHGDFYHDSPCFGGMWDAIEVDESNQTTCIIECKTTKRIEDWEDEIPEYYALQASLYAYLENCTEVAMICTVLDENDYKNIDNFEVNSSNTFIRRFNVLERYPDFKQMLQDASKFYDKYVLTGISPTPTASDKELLKILHTTTVDDDADLDELLKEYTVLKSWLDSESERIKPQQDKFKELAETIKSKLMSKADGQSILECECDGYTFTLSPSNRETVDKAKLLEDGIADKYITKTISYTMRVTERKE